MRCHISAMWQTEVWASAKQTFHNGSKCRANKHMEIGLQVLKAISLTVRVIHCSVARDEQGRNAWVQVMMKASQIDHVQTQ